MTTPSPSSVPAVGIRTGRIGAPIRILLLGQEKVGKTTFCAAAPAPVFLDAESGSGFIDVPRLEFQSGLAPKSLAEIIGALTWLGKELHDFATLVIDTADALEAIIWRDLCARNGWDTIEKPGYGKGYVAAVEDWRRLLAICDRLREVRGMGIILTAHTTIKNFANPAGEDYSRFEPCLHKQAANVIKGWADCILFASHEDLADKKSGKAVTTGRRVLRTQRDPAWDAGNRLGLPPVIPLDWTAFAQAGKLQGVFMYGEQNASA